MEIGPQDPYPPEQTPSVPPSWPQVEPVPGWEPVPTTGHEPYPPRPQARTLSRVLVIAAWAVILVIVLAQFLVNLMAPPLGDPSDDPMGYMIMRMQGRYMVGAAELLSGQGPTLLAQGGAALNAGTVGQRARFVVLAAELGGAESAQEYLAKLEDLIATEEARALALDEPFELSERDAETMDVLRTLYGEAGSPDSEPATARIAQLTDEQRAHLTEALDWYGELALVPASEGETPERAAVIRRATHAFIYIITAVCLAGVFALGGFIGLIIWAVTAFMGKLRSGVPRGAHYHGIYAETFAFWMILFVVFMVGAELLSQAVPKAAMAVLLIAFFGTLVALAYPVARGVPWGQVRQDIGWTGGRKPALEPVLGIGGYAMAIPILAVGIAITFVLLMIQSALTPAPGALDPIGGPAHPIVLESQTSVWAVLQVLLLGAVAAPIVEETMFRGVLYRHLRDASRTWGPALSIFIATAINGFIFAAIHPQGWVAIPALMSLATAFTLVREWRGTLWGPMIMHGINNLAILGSLSYLAAL